MTIEPVRLTPEARDRLINMEGDILMLDEEIQRAKRAGLDVAELEEKVKKAKNLREGILREYST